MNEHTDASQNLFRYFGSQQNSSSVSVLFGGFFFFVFGRPFQVVFNLTFADLEGRSDVAGRFDCVE